MTDFSSIPVEQLRKMKAEAMASLHRAMVSGSRSGARKADLDAYINELQMAIDQATGKPTSSGPFYFTRR